MPECPKGWQRYMPSCYKYFNNKKDVYGAKEECGNHKGYLVAINDTNENEFLKENFLNEYDFVYIGAKKRRAGDGSG